VSGRSSSRDGSLHLTQHTPKRESATAITLAGQPPSDVWTDLSSDLLSEIATGVDRVVTDHSLSPPRALAQFITTNDTPTDRDRSIGSIISSLRSGVRSQWWWAAARFVTSLGGGDVLDGGVRTGLDDVCEIAQLVETPHPIVITFGEEFKQQRADQRRAICRLISSLTTVTDVYLVAETYLLEQWLAHTHAADLPGSLTEQRNTRQHGASAKSETVQRAIKRFDIDGGIIELLRSVAGTPTETRTLDVLEAELDVERNTIYNRLHHLREYDLISDTLSTPDGSAVSLTSTGRAYLDAVYESAGVQTTLEESLIAAGKSSNNMPCNPASTREGGDGGGWTRNRLPYLHSLRSIPRHQFHAATSTATDSDLSVVDTNIGLLADRAAPGIHYDHDDRTLLVSAEYDNPMSYWVCIARALCNSRIWDWILDPDKLDAPHGDKFRSLFKDHKEVLRQLRCLGYTPNDITDIEAYRDYLLEAKDDLLKLTKRLSNGDYPDEQDRSEFRGTILSDAHGLAGIMAHILDLVDVEIVREVRVPRYRQFDRQQRQALARTIAKGSTIQSVYNEATTERQIFERREGKREQMIAVDADAQDPYADLIGSFVIVGDFKTQKDGFVQLLDDVMGSRSPHDDAPEFNLNLSIKGHLSRSDYAQTVTRLCREKNLKPTPEAISTLAGVCNSPYEVATALNWLQANDDRRTIDSREVRFALSQLDVDDILRGTSSTPRKALMALLNATKPLSQSELADRADVSERSLRDHLPDLLDLGVIDETPTGYRFRLAFDTAAERTDDRYPLYVVDPEIRPEIHQAAKALKTARQHHFETPITDDEFPTWSGQQACVDLRSIHDPEVWIREVLPLLWAIECRGVYRDDPELRPLLGSGNTEVTVGPEIPQHRLAEYSASTAAG